MCLICMILISIPNTIRWWWWLWSHDTINSFLFFSFFEGKKYYNSRYQKTCWGSWTCVIIIHSIQSYAQNKTKFDFQSFLQTERKKKKTSMKIKSNRIPLFIGHAVKQTKTKRTSRSSRSWHLSIIFIWMFCCRENFCSGKAFIFKKFIHFPNLKWKFTFFLPLEIRYIFPNEMWKQLL